MVPSSALLAQETSQALDSLQPGLLSVAAATPISRGQVSLAAKKPWVDLWGRGAVHTSLMNVRCLCLKRLGLSLQFATV